MKRPRQRRQRRSRSVFRSLVKAIDEIGVVGDRLDFIELTLDDVQQLLSFVSREKPELLELLTNGRGRRRARTPRANPPTPPYATSVEIKWSERKAEVTVDAWRVFVLPRRLGMLLEVLLAESEPASGVSDGWKTREEIRRLLSAKSGTACTKHCAENLISRLRIALARRAQLEHLIQIDPGRGVRFALRRYNSQNPNDRS